MSSKASRLRAKRARNAGDGMDLAAVPRRKAQGRSRMTEIREKPEDASLAAIEARCRRAGVQATEDAMREMKAPWHGCKAGQAIHAHARSEAERQRLWTAAQHVRAAYVAMCRLKGLPLPHATCLRILLPVEAMHADAETAPADLRTEDERLWAAISGWERVKAWISRYGRHTAGITERCVIADQSCENTTAMLLALNVVADGLEGSR